MINSKLVLITFSYWQILSFYNNTSTLVEMCRVKLKGGSRGVTDSKQFTLMQISTYKWALILLKYSRLIKSTHMHKIIHIFRLSYLSPTWAPTAAHHHHHHHHHRCHPCNYVLYHVLLPGSLEAKGGDIKPDGFGDVIHCMDWICTDLNLQLTK